MQIIIQPDVKRVWAAIEYATALNRAKADPVRIPFLIDDEIVGSVSSQDAQWFANTIAGLNLDADGLSLAPVCSPDAPSVLEKMALQLRDASRLGKWRNELLRVTGDSGQIRGMIERAAIRPLGIRSFAVHLVAYVASTNDQPYGSMWVQQRALDKATDPGMWDTCAGGLSAGDESFYLSLEREVYEEAGLKLQDLQALGAVPKRGVSLHTHRNLPEGFLHEELLWWDIELPPSLTPINLDGEVAKFELWPINKVLVAIADGLFTPEAVLVIAQSLVQRGLLLAEN